MGSRSNELKVKIEHIPEEDEEDLEETTRQLASDLDSISSLIVDFVVNKESLQGARSGEIISLGEIVLKWTEVFLNTGAAAAIFTILNSWVKNRRRTLKIEKKGESKLIDVNGLSKAELDKLIDWIKKD